MERHVSTAKSKPPGFISSPTTTTHTVRLSSACVTIYVILWLCGEISVWNRQCEDVLAASHILKGRLRITTGIGLEFSCGGRSLFKLIKKANVCGRAKELSLIFPVCLITTINQICSRKLMWVMPKASLTKQQVCVYVLRIKDDSAPRHNQLRDDNNPGFVRLECLLGDGGTAGGDKATKGRPASVFLCVTSLVCHSAQIARQSKRKLQSKATRHQPGFCEMRKQILVCIYVYASPPLLWQNCLLSVTPAQERWAHQSHNMQP